LGKYLDQLASGVIEKYCRGIKFSKNRVMVALSAAEENPLLQKVLETQPSFFDDLVQNLGFSSEQTLDLWVFKIFSLDVKAQEPDDHWGAYSDERALKRITKIVEHEVNILRTLGPEKCLELKNDSLEEEFDRVVTQQMREERLKKKKFEAAIPTYALGNDYY